jgi:hypothetical protein
MGLSSRKDDRRRSAITGASIGIPAAVVGGVVMRVVEGWGGFALALVVAGLIGSQWVSYSGLGHRTPDPMRATLMFRWVDDAPAWRQALAVSQRRRAMTFRHRVSSAPSKMLSTRASTYSRLTEYSSAYP